MISIELLSKVLGKEIEHCTRAYGKQDIAFNYVNDERTYREINIHELVHRCKEWAKDTCMSVSSSVHNKSKNVRVYIVTLEYPNSSERFTADTEAKAIFEACKWILKNS